MRTIFATLLLSLCLKASALTSFYLQLYNADGTAQTNLVTMAAWPAQTNLFTTYSTNVIVGSSNLTLVPNPSGLSSNAAYPNVYRLTVSNLNASFIVNLPDTTNFISLATCVTNLPVFLGGVNNYAYVTNLLGFAPATNTQAGIISALAYTPATNTFGGITNSLGYVPATNSAQGFWFLVTNAVSQTNANINVSTNLLANHFGGLGTVPTIGVNTNGTGNGGTATGDANASDSAVTVTVVTTVPAANTAIFTNTFGRPYVTPPHVVWSGQFLSGSYQTTNSFVTNVTTNAFEFWSGKSAWIGTNTNSFTFLIVQ